jgi:hypothetical protein
MATRAEAQLARFDRAMSAPGAVLVLTGHEDYTWLRVKMPARVVRKYLEAEATKE